MGVSCRLQGIAMNRLRSCSRHTKASPVGMRPCLPALAAFSASVGAAIVRPKASPLDLLPRYRESGGFEEGEDGTAGDKTLQNVSISVARVSARLICESIRGISHAL